MEHRVKKNVNHQALICGIQQLFSEITEGFYTFFKIFLISSFSGFHYPKCLNTHRETDVLNIKFHNFLLLKGGVYGF